MQYTREIHDSYNKDVNDIEIILKLKSHIIELRHHIFHLHSKLQIVNVMYS